MNESDYKEGMKVGFEYKGKSYEGALTKDREGDWWISSDCDVFDKMNVCEDWDIKSYGYKYQDYISDWGLNITPLTQAKSPRPAEHISVLYGEIEFRDGDINGATPEEARAEVASLRSQAKTLAASLKRYEGYAERFNWRNQ